jgi:hypothetical protein
LEYIDIILWLNQLPFSRSVSSRRELLNSLDSNQTLMVDELLRVGEDPEVYVE